MNAETLNIILAYNCALPALLGMVYYKRMDNVFHPFIWCMWLSVLAETATRFVVNYDDYPISFVYTIHLYYVLNYIFLMLFFYKQQIISLQQLKYILTAAAVILIANCLYKNPSKNLLGEKTIVFHVILVYYAVDLLSQQVFNTTIALTKNGLFYIACGMLLYAFPVLQNTIRIVVRSYYDLSTERIIALQHIFEIANAASYILFLFGVIYLPKKQAINFTPHE
jgi:hypothetical protein